jgi:hypothetical protein
LLDDALKIVMRGDNRKGGSAGKPARRRELTNCLRPSMMHSFAVHLLSVTIGCV